MNEDKNQEFLHEALDRAHIASSHLQMALGNHPTVGKYGDISAAYEKAVTEIENLYQLIGSKMK